VRVVILAGGKGTRLLPYTVVIPKPLMPLGELPILEVIIRQLVRHGFDHITLAVNHHAKLIKAFFMDGAKWGTRIDYSIEDKPLSTMAPIRLIENLPDNFMVMNGDILTDLDYEAFAAHHTSNGNLFTISSYARDHIVDYGVLETDGCGTLTTFSEKPRVHYEVSMGVYMLNRSVLEFIPVDQPYGFDDLMRDLLAAGRPAAVQRHDGFWLDIGRPDDYAIAVEEFERMKGKLLGE
jgi:NDP-sugar pyrophosphorylase family protein